MNLGPDHSRMVAVADTGNGGVVAARGRGLRHFQRGMSAAGSSHDQRATVAAVAQRAASLCNHEWSGNWCNALGIKTVV